MNTFKALALSQHLLTALDALGYESPTPIQQQSIPVLLSGQDILAQAQTGTGKTAAFALPILERIDTRNKKPQALILAPTRELAIQVAEAFQAYAQKLEGLHITPIYGGQDYQVQLRALKRNPQIIVGTPGRLMDHLRRGTLKIEALKTVVLDEADEMLKMGFIEDIEWILGHITHEHQTALFSATMPTSIQNIAKRYLNNPKKILVKAKHNTVDGIQQFCIRAEQQQKKDVLLRFLEIENVDAAIIFTRTKSASDDLADKLKACGHAAAALNGDMPQAARKKVIDRIKNGSLNIIVATDVAARGIDVERISHVFNYDIPFDAESYIHRIGRTGRAGRKGKAFLFITPREQRLYQGIERATHQSITEIEPPSIEAINNKQHKKLIDDIAALIQDGKALRPFYQLVNDISQHTDCNTEEIAAAFAYLLQKTNPILKPLKAQAKPIDSNSKRHSRPRHSQKKSNEKPPRRKHKPRKKSK